MGVIGDNPQFPVVDRAPTFGTVVGNFNATDYRDWATWTAVSFPVGWMSGSMSGPGIRVPAMYCSGLIGGLAGFMWAYQSSGGRLMGFLPNEAEVRSSGR
mmetsp:Transcript_1246/g.5528  ORF Transcript_1246/g.5528 Transcript_1246/m.5528 type:complete len:100 (+) Transcript_1246:217-516(+)